MNAPILEIHEPAAPEGWTVTDVSSADWALSRISDLEREQQDLDAQYEAAVARLAMKRDALVAKAQRGIDFFRGHLERWAQANRATLLGAGKKKSRQFLHGTIAWRNTGGGLVVADKEALLAWARDAGMVRVTEAPDLAAIKKHAKETGEIPPGTEVELESERVVITGGATE